MDDLFDGISPVLPHKLFKDRVEEDIKKGGNALLPFAEVQSTRHLLLKMKTMMPELEKVQIPLLEEQTRKRLDLMDII